MGDPSSAKPARAEDPNRREPPASERLDSWKEIAAYLRRGARTAQRWEREQGLPVRRLQHDKLGSVYAYRSELDAWWQARGADLENEPASTREGDASVAVLRFTDLSREKDQAYFCEGIAEEIVGALSRLEGLQVASRSSAFRFDPASADVSEIGRRLRVRTLLEGSLRKSEQRLRIVVRLTDTRSGYQLWSDTYDREMTDVFAIQEEIARSVVRALEITLSSREKAVLSRPATRNVQAYDCYLRGRKFFYGYGPRDMEFAIQMFTRAITLDQNYAVAFAGLADCWSYLYLYSTRDPVLRDQADWASARAVELDNESAAAHASRAVALSLNERDEEAVSEFETAIRQDPNLFEAYYFYARHAFAHGDPAKAVRLYEEAMRVNPDDYQSPLLAPQSYEDLGLLEQAKASRQRGIQAAERHLQLNPDDARALYMAANGMAALGQGERARRWAGRALALRPDEPMLLYNIGCIYSLLGAIEEAIDCLERAVRTGISHKGWYEHDNNLDPLRSHPRFQKLLDSLS